MFSEFTYLVHFIRYHIRIYSSSVVPYFWLLSAHSTAFIGIILLVRRGPHVISSKAACSRPPSLYRGSSMQVHVLAVVCGMMCCCLIRAQPIWTAGFWSSDAVTCK